jgi:hypothetical protein
MSLRSTICSRHVGGRYFVDIPYWVEDVGGGAGDHAGPGRDGVYGNPEHRSAQPIPMVELVAVHEQDADHISL